MPTDEEGSAGAVKAGCDMCCGDDYSTLPKAVRQGLVTEAEMDAALGRVLERGSASACSIRRSKLPYAGFRLRTTTLTNITRWPCARRANPWCC